MTKTMEALEKFAQALPPTLPAQPCGDLPRAEDTLTAQVQSPTNQATFAPFRVNGTGPDPGPLSARRDTAGHGDLPHAAGPLSGVPRADCGGALPAGGPGQPCALHSEARAELKAEAAAKSLPAAVRSDGLTRRGSQCQWQRLIGVSLLEVTTGLR